MKKADLVASVAERSDLSKAEAQRAVDATVEAITDNLNNPGDNVALTGFGTFEVREQAARQGRNPQTGETVKIPAKKAVKFKPGKTLKDAVQ